MLSSSYVFFFSHSMFFSHELVVHILRKRIMLHFLLFVPTLLYAVLNYYVFIFTYVLALISSLLFDDTL